MGNYIGNLNNVATLVANNIYDDKGAICELVANYYDNDATSVDIYFEYSNEMGKVYITKIIIKGNGSGMIRYRLENLLSICESDKKEGKSKLYGRKYLGSYGVAFASFQRLGNKLQIYSKTKEDGELYMEVNVDDKNIVTSSEILESKDFIVNYDTGVTLIISNCKIPEEVFENKKGTSDLSLKLSLLPLSNMFKIFVNDDEIIKYTNGELIKNPKGDFICCNEFKFHVEVFFEKTDGKTIHPYYRGVHFVINNRIIEYDLFNYARNQITSPGSIASSLMVYIYADELAGQLNVSRNRLNDEVLVRDIELSIGKFLSDIRYMLIKDKSNQKENSSITGKKEELDSYECQNESDDVKKDIDAEQLIKKQRIKNAKIMKMRKIDKLVNMNLKFCYEPKQESELIILVTCMCQMDLLPFQILEYNSKAHIDSVIIDNKNSFKCMEFEFDLNNFFDHKHSFIYADLICCWKFDIARFEIAVERYKEVYTNISSIDIIQNGQKAAHQYALKFNYGEYEKYIKVYEISTIIDESNY